MKKVKVITVSKVASSSFAAALAKQRMNGAARYKVTHSHSLIDLKETLDNDKNVLIISGIRNPMDRNISYFFQSATDKVHNSFKTKKNNYQGELIDVPNLYQMNVDEAIHKFFSLDFHTGYNDWFDEFFELTNITEFDKEKGYQLYQLPNGNQLLFYVFERLPEIKRELAAIFDIPSVPHINMRKNNLYQKFKEKIQFSDEYKKQFNHPWMDLFY